MVDRYCLRLAFGPQVGSPVRERIEYAFRVFCAVYGFTPVEAGNVPTLGYGMTEHIALPAGYQARPLTEPAPAPPRQNPPDWLGEIFEWLSGAHEFSVTKTDAVGRLEYGESLHGKFQLDPRVPYAAVAMRELNERIQSVVGAGWPTRPLNPWGPAHRCAVAATHDVDFLPVSRVGNVRRLLKDLGVAALLQRDARLVGQILRAAGAGSQSLRHVAAEEKRRGIRSTYNVIPRRAHRRDATYDIHDPKVRALLDELVAAGDEIGVHGSYTSLEAKGRLAEEYRMLRQAGYAVVGGRQHWLRYRTHSELIEEICAAGGWYDCTFGYRAELGFRHGACFPFPPYDFARERAFPLLELPLVIMDVTVDEKNRNGENAALQCRQLLDTVGEFGWGGVSLLWHDTTFGHAAVAREVGEMYWDLKEENTRWMPAGELVGEIWPRYAAAGLLPANKP